jgi:BMFP domain-containing protein YqiC
LVQAQVERVLNNLDVVKREEFEAVRDMARRAREENDRLSERLAALESQVAKSKGSFETPAESASATLPDDHVSGEPPSA